MERHFALPITLAAALHAGLLFGYRPAHVTATEDATRISTVSKPMPPIEVALNPPEPESNPNEPVASKGSSDTERPTAPELPPTDASDRITVDLPPVTHSVTTDIKMDLRPPGIPDGSDNAGDLSNALTTARQLDNPPRTRLQTPPLYPAEARRTGISGTVMVEFTVDEKGVVFDPHVVSSTDRIFEDATLRAVAKWRFEPGTHAGRVVRFRMAVPVVFNLNDN
jgi:protein TonB